MLHFNYCCDSTIILNCVIHKNDFDLWPPVSLTLGQVIQNLIDQWVNQSISLFQEYRDRHREEETDKHCLKYKEIMTYYNITHSLYNITADRHKNTCNIKQTDYYGRTLSERPCYCPCFFSYFFYSRLSWPNGWTDLHETFTRGRY